VPSAIVDRVDEGGLGTGTIPLVGVRGASWAQNEYRLDGINVTDPYDTGKPLLYPGFGSLIEFQVSTAFHSSEVQVPGGSFDLATRSGSREYHGAAEAYYLGEPFESNNLNSRLRGFGFNTTPHFERFGEGEFSFGGAVPRVREWAFFTDLGIQHLSKTLPEFAGAPTTTVLSGVVRVDGKIGARDVAGGLVMGQIVDNSNLGAGAGVSPSATLRGHDRYEIIQGHWTHRQNAETAYELGFGFSHASPTDTFQRGITTSPSTVQLFTGTLGGAAPLESDAARSRFSLLGQGQTVRRFPGRVSHLLDFGVDLEEALDTESLRAFDDIQELFFPAGVPSEIIEFNTPSLTRQRLRAVSMYLDDQIQIADWLFVRVGLNLDSSNARQLDGIGSVVSWTSLAPRIGLAVPVLRRFGDTRLLASFARYYHALPAQYAGFANPDSLGGRVFTWADKNGDGLFQAGEEGRLLRAFGGPVASIDANLARPYTDEWVLGVERVFEHRIEANLRLVARNTRRRVETVNAGIPASAYTPVKIVDPGNDGVLGTADDQVLTVFNQDPRTLGQDRYLLTNPAGLDAIYRGLEAVIRAGLFRDWGLSVSFTAFKAIGNTSPGNGQLQNDQGVIGSLFDDPNTLLNDRGRLFFDRAFVGQITAYGRAPFGLHLGSVIKYYDGLPFGRELIVTGLNQGPIIVMATPRGEPGGFRTQFNLTFDQRISREFKIGKNRFTAMIDAFNLLNLNKNLLESFMTGPLFQQRVPLLVENPRVIRFGIKWTR